MIILNLRQIRRFIISVFSTMFCEKFSEKQPKYSCNYCYYKCTRNGDWTKHINTVKHIHRTTLVDKVNQINPKINECQLCDYKCIKPSDWKKHLATSKHKIRTDILNYSKNISNISRQKVYHNPLELSDISKKILNSAESKTGDKSPKNRHQLPNHLPSQNIIITNKIDPQEEKKSPHYVCENCDKKYLSRNGLWYHKQRCLTKKTQPSYNEVLEIVNKDKEFQNFLIEQNKQFMEYIMKQNAQPNITNNKNTKKIKTTTNNNNNIITNNNNTFCINVFLNEKCKDALNISEFVDTIILGINELEETARLGYAPGISKIFINGLKKLDVCKRPVHCSDLKRSTLYIKNNNEWIKEQDDNINLITAIKQVANKNFKNIFEWQKLYPEYNDSTSKQNDKYHKLICNTMSGSTQEEQIHNYDKIIKNIIKEVVIEKN